MLERLLLILLKFDCCKAPCSFRNCHNPSVTLLLSHSCHTSVTILLAHFSCHNPPVTLLLSHSCLTFPVTLLSYSCHTSHVRLSHFCHTPVTLLSQSSCHTSVTILLSHFSCHNPPVTLLLSHSSCHTPPGVTCGKVFMSVSHMLIFILPFK